MLGRVQALVFVIAIVFLAGCKSATLAGGDYSNVFLCPDPLPESAAYQLYKNQPSGEFSRIRYLINLVRFSEVTFVRNGEMFSGNNAARWLEYKLNRYGEAVETADDFIESVASYSLKTKKEYYLIFPNKSRCLVRYVLQNELARLKQLEQDLAASEKKIEVVQSILVNPDLAREVLENEELAREILQKENLVEKVLENENLVEEVLENESIVKEVLKETKPEGEVKEDAPAQNVTESGEKIAGSLIATPLAIVASTNLIDFTPKEK